MKHIKITGTETGRRRRRVGNTLLAWALVLCIVVIVCVIGAKVFLTMGERSLKKNATSQGPVIVEESGEGESEEVQIAIDPEVQKIWKETWVSYNGKVYEYNEDMLTFLVLGIDDMGKVKKSKDKTGGGQSDAIFLFCMNPRTKEIKLIGVNRDTMVNVVMVGCGDHGEDVVAQAEIAVQHGFGDGMEQSCELTRDAVGKLFYDLPIHGYLAMNMGGIAALNDALGGVTLTCLEDLTKKHKNWKEGTEITLKGTDAYDYIHYRDTKQVESARNRLARQKQYLSIMGNTAMDKVKEDFTFAVTLYTKFKPYIVTDLSLDQITWLASQASDYKL
ncbi:MAG: LCP family protein, partial [Acetatifactor sp.]|nr:LCP family protein [Acetatifactor sp.]